MMKTLFRKTVLFSLLSHITLFGIFGLTFTGNAANLSNPDIYFWGGVLNNTGITGAQFMNLGNMKQIAVTRGQPLGLGKDKDAVFGAPFLSIKPLVSAAFNESKPDFAREELAWIRPPKLKEPVIIFHPSLAHDFSLYFSDRQVVHVELDFKISPREGPEPVLVKRKISSGNLEVDLLIQRNIEHYLFIQESRFAPGKWQTVKIDLTGDND
jgi:hypothetical protein